MLEVHDELMTPGCPQCAVKHLSAALYHRVHLVCWGEATRPDEYMVCVCKAYINLVEVRAGYLSHLWYAVGALVRAEEHMAPRGMGKCVAREARLMLEEYGVEALLDALNCIREGTAPDHADWAYAHLGEAMRELPAMQAEMRMDDLIGSIERVRREYFVTEEAPVASAEDAEKGGESEVATKKAAKKAPAFLKKEDPKAKKAACKGGKCKGKGKKC